MSDGLILALDQGTTSTRAILFGPGGRVAAQAARPLPQAYPADGWVEHDAERIFSDAVAVMRQAIAASGRPPSAVSALGIANQRETVVVWERATGRAIHPAIVWQDRRTAPVCGRLRDAGCEPEVTATTGLLLDPYFSATKIAWLLDHVDGARAAAQRGELAAGTIDAWLVVRLSGGRVHATDPTNASRTSLMDLESQVWSPAMCELFGVPIGTLPEIRDTAGDFGSPDSGLLGAAVPIRAAVGDQQAALFGHGCVEAGGLKATYGTGGFVLLHTGGAAPRSTARLLTTAAARVGGRAAYALEGSIFSAGATLQWICEQLGVGGVKALESLAQRARPGHGVVLVPAFTGLGAPYWDAQARGALLGLTRDAGLPEIAAAAYDAVALQTRDLLEAMAADAPAALRGATVLRIDGGMARSAWFAQRLADLTGLQVRRSGETEMTALGAALLAGLETDPASPEAGARHKVRLHTPAVDGPARDVAFRRWRSAVAATRSFAGDA